MEERRDSRHNDSHRRYRESSRRRYHSERTPDGDMSAGRRRHRSRSPRDARQSKRRHSDRSIDSSRSLSPRYRQSHSEDHRRPSRPLRSPSYSPPRRRRHGNEDEPRPSHRKERHRSRSPPRKHSQSPQKPISSIRSHAPLPSQQAAFNKNPHNDQDNSAIIRPEPEAEKQKPNYAPSGLLAAETNTVANTSIVLKYNEPPEARLPPASAPWRLYIFKGSDLLETLPLHTRTCWLFGRERAVVDFPTEHPSCSKQHAVVQFRYVEKKNEWGEKRGGVKPYVLDLESANGTVVNGGRVPERRFVEVRSGDVLGFGESTREYVIMLPPKE